jgi:hypothetical protein
MNSPGSSAKTAFRLSPRTISTAANLLLVSGVAVLSMALRSFSNVVLQKLGALGVLATSFPHWLAVYRVHGDRCALRLQLAMLPWLEILTRIRKLTLPTEKKLRHKHPPNQDAFPALEGLTDEIEHLGFKQQDDTGWDWQDYAQFFRLFYKDSERTQAAICLIDQHDVAFYYLSVSSRGSDGRILDDLELSFRLQLEVSAAVAGEPGQRG